MPGGCVVQQLCANGPSAALKRRRKKIGPIFWKKLSTCWNRQGFRTEHMGVEEAGNLTRIQCRRYGNGRYLETVQCNNWNQTIYKKKGARKRKQTNIKQTKNSETAWKLGRKVGHFPLPHVSTCVIRCSRALKKSSGGLLTSPKPAPVLQFNFRACALQFCRCEGRSGQLLIVVPSSGCAAIAIETVLLEKLFINMKCAGPDLQPVVETCLSRGQHTAKPFVGRWRVHHPNLQSTAGHQCFGWFQLIFFFVALTFRQAFWGEVTKCRRKKWTHNQTVRTPWCLWGKSVGLVIGHCCWWRGKLIASILFWTKVWRLLQWKNLSLEHGWKNWSEQQNGCCPSRGFVLQQLHHTVRNCQSAERKKKRPRSGDEFHQQVGHSDEPQLVLIAKPCHIHSVLHTAVNAFLLSCCWERSCKPFFLSWFHRPRTRPVLIIFNQAIHAIWYRGFFPRKKTTLFFWGRVMQHGNLEKFAWWTPTVCMSGCFRRKGRVLRIAGPDARPHMSIGTAR